MRLFRLLDDIRQAQHKNMASLFLKEIQFNQIHYSTP